MRDDERGPREARAYYAGRKPRVVSLDDGSRVLVVSVAQSYRRTIFRMLTSRSLRLDVDYEIGDRGPAPWDGRPLRERQELIREAMRREGYEVRVRKDEEREVARANAGFGRDLQSYVD